MNGALSGGESRPSVRGVFIFALLAAFALLSLIVVLVGARAYRSVYQAAEAAYVSRTGMSYLIGKVRGADEAGMVTVFQQDGSDVLSLGGLYGGERYNTYIYCRDGSICEYFAAADQAFSPDFGEKILSAEALSLQLENGLLTVSLTDEDGVSSSVSICLAAGGEAGA